MAAGLKPGVSRGSDSAKSASVTSCIHAAKSPLVAPNCLVTQIAHTNASARSAHPSSRESAIRTLSSISSQPACVRVCLLLCLEDGEALKLAVNENIAVPACLSECA